MVDCFNVRNTKAPKKDEENVFSTMQFLESSNFGAGAGNAAVTIRARTDIIPLSSTRNTYGLLHNGSRSAHNYRTLT